MRYCPGCCREVATDVIKAIASFPAFIICTVCGWCIDEEER